MLSQRISPGSASEWRRRRGASEGGGGCVARGRPELSDALVLEDVYMFEEARKTIAADRQALSAFMFCCSRLM